MWFSLYLPRVMGVGDSRISSPWCLILDKIQWHRTTPLGWHGIPIQLGILINWTVMPAHPLLRPIAKDIFFDGITIAQTYFPIGKFDKPCYQKLSATSINVNPLRNTEPIRSPKNKMVVLQLNVDGFSFITFKILKAKSKIPSVRVNKCSYFPYLSTSEMRAYFQWPIIKFCGLHLQQRETTWCWLKT